MGRGKSMGDTEYRASLKPFDTPADMANLHPLQAVHQLLDLNRNDKHRATYKIEVDKGTNTLPRSARIFIDGGSGGCTQRSTEDGLLISEGEQAWFGWNNSSFGGMIPLDYREYHPRYAFGLVEADPVAVKQTMEMIWWLDQVQTPRIDPNTYATFGRSYSGRSEGTISLHTQWDTQPGAKAL